MEITRTCRECGNRFHSTVNAALCDECLVELVFMRRSKVTTKSKDDVRDVGLVMQLLTDGVAQWKRLKEDQLVVGQTI